MTQFHRISLFFVLLSLCLTINLPFTFGLSPRLPVTLPYGNPEPVPLDSAASQLLVPHSIHPIEDPTNATNTDPYNCFKTSPFAPNRPAYADCLSAIRRLSKDARPGLFHTGRPQNAFKLPRAETVDSCRMIIGLTATAVTGENGSWAGVGENAGQLNLQCVQFGTKKELSYGGSTTAGDSGLITIVLLYSGRSAGSELGDNETSVASF